MKRLGRLFALLVGLTGFARASEATVPLEDFFREITFNEIKVSPDGTKVAALSTWKEHLNLYVIDLKTKKPTMLTGLTTMSVAGVGWVGNNRLIFTGVKDGGGTGGFFAIDADGKNSRTLGESVEQQANNGARIFRQTDFLDFYAQSTDEVLAVSNERRLYEPDVYRLNVHSGAKQMVAMNPGKIVGWVADSTGAVRVGYGASGGSHFLILRDGAKGEFREIKRWNFREGDCEPLAFDETDQRIYVRTSLGGDTAAIALFDLKTASVIKELFHDAVYDAADVILHRQTRELLGYVIERERPEFVWVAENMKKLQALVDESLPDTHNLFYSRSSDNAWAVIDARSDRDPGTFYLLNTHDLAMEKLVSRAAWIKPAQMAAMQPIQYQARDGLTIRGYLTMPVNSTGKNLPLIINPHGGPQARDSWGYTPEVQLLASRGYAVLQVNFRGSTGYGRKFEQAGFGQWGLAMQDDVTDAVRWAIAQGIADPKRVAIYGASYGGYATMAGLAFTPELYCCGVNYVGVTDAALLLKTIPEGWEDSRVELEAMIGSTKKDRERLQATSPLLHVDQVRVPVFFAYGRLDDRVDIKHGTKMASVLRKKGIPVVWMEREDEGHGYHRMKNKLAFYRELEKFLNQYVPH